MSIAVQQDHQILERQQPIFDIPGIGWRTARVLYESGVRTVDQFLAVPDLMLRETFGPSLIGVRQRAQQNIAAVPARQPMFHSLFRLLSA